jgi:putative oxidoreductase
MSTTTMAAPRLPAMPRLRTLAPPAVLAGRILFSAIFILAAPNHFSQATIGYAASKGVPLAGVLVPLSGLLALAGGLAVLLGLYARIGALLLVVFLVPIAFWIHAFWAESDPAMQAMQMANFLKNISMAGAALLIACFGAGPWSFDARRDAQRTP